MKENFGNVMRSYATIREVIVESEAKLKEMVENVKQSDDYQAIENWLIINKQSLSELEEEIKEAALFDFQVTGNKKPFDGVGIREMTKFVYEIEGAVQWAKVNAPMVVYETIDKKKFEKILSVTPPEILPEYIHVFKEPTVTITTDLSMYVVPIDSPLGPEQGNENES